MYILDYNSFEAYFDVRDCDTFNFVLSFKIALTICGLLWFYTNFKIICSSSVKNAMTILSGVALIL